MKDKIKSLIAQGEGLKVEFKEATARIPACVYDTVCSFLNTKGGDILLGVSDSGEILGVNEKAAFGMQQNFSSSVNNTQFINPPFCLSLDKYEIDNKTVLHTFVPESSQVHRYKNIIYKRFHDADINITNNQEEVRNLYNQKSFSYSENKIFKAVTIDDLRLDLLDKVRTIVTIRNASHSWVSMDNMTILQNMGLYQKDLNTGEAGFTLACILLLGKDEIIHSAVPAFKIDLIKKVENKDRYDDREVLSTNLIDSYEKAMDFIAKHLPSPFYLEGDKRIDLRNIIFREIIANAIVHKEYLGAEPTKIVIEEDKIYTENSNKPYINGLITMDNTTSHPKNPTIAKFFRELGLVEELGSGFNKLFHYAKIYTGFNPVIEDLPIFKFSLQIPFFKKEFQVARGSNILTSVDGTPITDIEGKTTEVLVPDTLTVPVGGTVTGTVSSTVENIILDFCAEPKKAREIMQLIGLTKKQYFLDTILKPLMDKGLIERTNPQSPHAPNQKYVTVRKESKNG